MHDLQTICSLKLNDELPAIIKMDFQNTSRVRRSIHSRCSKNVILILVSRCSEHNYALEILLGLQIIYSYCLLYKNLLCFDAS